MATKKLSTALAELSTNSTPSQNDSLILSAVDGTAQRLPISTLTPPTLQNGVSGGERNYIYSNSKDNSHAVMSGTFKVFQNEGRCYIRHKFWGSTDDYDDGQWTTKEIPYVNTSANGVMQSAMLVRLRDGVWKETGSTTTAINITYPNYAEGGVKTLTLSAATSAKAGCMTAADKVRLDTLYDNARDLGNYPSEEDALNALADLAICANPKIVHAHLTYGGGNMSITMVQSIENDYARQVIYNKAKVFQRGIYFTDASRTAIKYKEDWSCLFGDRLQWNSSENKYVLKQFDLTFNKSVTDPIPTATTSNDGLMSKADKQLLEQIKTKLSL